MTAMAWSKHHRPPDLMVEKRPADQAEAGLQPGYGLGFVITLNALYSLPLPHEDTEAGEDYKMSKEAW